MTDDAEPTGSHPVPRAERFGRLLSAHIAQLVRDGPSLIDDALDAVRSGRMGGSYVDEWERILLAGPAAVVAILESADDAVQPLQSDDPFSMLGIVAVEDRAQMIEQVYDRRPRR